MKDFELIAEEMRPVIYSIIRSLNIYKNQEEYYQIGLIGLWQAYQSFDPNKGTFLTYAYAYIRGAILTQLRKDVRKDHKEIYANDYELQSIMDSKGQTHELQLEMQELLQKLPNKLRIFAELHFVKGMSIKEIADELGAGYPTVKKWKRGVIEQIKSLIKQ